MFSFLAKRQGILDGVCITGGEPLLQPDIEEFIRKVKELGYQVKLDTNGSNVLRLRRLVEQGLVDYVAMDIKNAPDKYGMTIGIEEYDMSNIFQSVEKVKELGYQVKLDTNGSNVLRLRRLVEQGLVDYVAMDIKNAPDKYGMTIGIEEYDMSNIFQSVDFLMSGDVPYEFRTTVVRQFHKREDFAAIGRWIKGAKQYYLQSFVDSGDLICPGMKGYTKEIMEQALAETAGGTGACGLCSNGYQKCSG